MGTSQSYSAPPSWSDLKTDVTRAAKEVALPRYKSKDLLRSFINHNGGSRVFSGHTGGGGGGGGSAIASGGAARTVANRLASFITSVNTLGFSGTLQNYGWNDLVGKPIHEVLNALLDRLGGDATTIEDVDARMALAKLQEKYFAEAETPEAFEILINSQVERLEPLLQDYFGFYLHELFCRVFFERLVQRVGEIKAHSFFNEIMDVITSTLANRTSDRNFNNINWNGQEGKALIEDVMETTLNILGGVE